jgi:xanthine/uracil permease
MGLLDIVTPAWFSQVLDYSGPNIQLAGFLEGVNLLVETPFILTMLVAVLLNLIMPADRSHLKAPLSPQRSDGYPMVKPE